MYISFLLNRKYILKDITQTYAAEIKNKCDSVYIRSCGTRTMLSYTTIIQLL